MNTQTQNVQLRCITADQGMWIRRRDAQDPVHFSKTVYLGASDSEENYIEVSQAEKDAYDAEHAPNNTEPTTQATEALMAEKHMRSE